MTHHHHIAAFYLHCAQMARQSIAFGMFTEQYYFGRAFLYSDF